MNFALDDEQQALKDSARSLLSRESTAAVRRSRYNRVEWSSTAENGGESPVGGLWGHVVHSGWTALLVPEEYGGLGRSVIELCLVLEETGRALAPVPLWETAALAVPLLVASGDRDGLTRIVEGGSATALTAPGLAPEAHAVDVVVGGTGTPTPMDCLDRNRTLCRVEGTVADESALQVATVALCAETIGVARWVLDTTAAYAKSREQFGVPIGSFQAVKHKLADMLLDLERASASTYYAAMCVAAGDPDATRAVHVAKGVTGDASRRAAKDGIQIHGGIGFTWEHDLHLYLRRIYGNEPLLGGAAHHRSRLADLILA